MERMVRVPGSASSVQRRVANPTEMNQVPGPQYELMAVQSAGPVETRMRPGKRGGAWHSRCGVMSPANGEYCEQCAMPIRANAAYAYMAQQHVSRVRNQ